MGVVTICAWVVCDSEVGVVTICAWVVCDSEVGVTSGCGHHMCLGSVYRLLIHLRNEVMHLLD